MQPGLVLLSLAEALIEIAVAEYRPYRVTMSLAQATILAAIYAKRPSEDLRRRTY